MSALTEPPKIRRCFYRTPPIICEEPWERLEFCGFDISVVDRLPPLYYQLDKMHFLLKEDVRNGLYYHCHDKKLLELLLETSDYTRVAETLYSNMMGNESEIPQNNGEQLAPSIFGDLSGLGEGLFDEALFEEEYVDIMN